MTSVGTFSGSWSEWDEFVKSCADWTPYHLSGWRRIVERVFGHECLYLAARDSAHALVAVLPLVRVESALFGHYLVSMPFLNYGGPLGDPSAMRLLASHASELATASGADLLELRCRSPLPLDLDVSHRKITVRLDLPVGGDADPLWRALDAKVRSQIRRPMKAGIEVRFGLDQLGPFFDVFAHHMRDLGTPTHSHRFFEAVLEEFPTAAWFGVAYSDDQPIAAGCGFHWASEFEMLWAASLREHSRTAPNMLLYWRFIERCVREGVERFDFGRCTPGGGTHRFKQQWGGRDEALWWYQQSAGRAATPTPGDARFAWGPRIWKRLPVAVATTIGPRVVRYLP